MTRRRGVAGLGPAGAVLALLAGCASAIQPIGPDSELGRARETVPTDAGVDESARLSAEAEAAYARRPDARAVALAEELWLRAALADPVAAEPVVGLTLARIWLARNVGAPAERDAKAAAAVQTAQWCAEREPERADCPYWLALAVGVQAEQRRVTAVDGLKVMIDLLRRMIETWEDLDYAGPRRVLSMVLVRAPGWPTGPGDPDEGLVHARRAVELFPEYPPNLLALAAALHAVEDPAASRRRYEEALEAARRWRDRRHPDAADWIEEAEAEAEKAR